MKLGIGTYAYTWSMGLPGAMPERPMTGLDLLAKARELGVRVVQFGPNYNYEPELDAIIERAREWGIELEIGTKGIEPDHLRKWIGVAKRAGSTLLRSLPECVDAELVAKLKCIEPELRAAGVRLALENHSLTPAEDLARALDAVGSPWVGVALDTVNSLAIPEDTERVARTLAPYTICLHVKDFQVARIWHMMGFTVEGRPAGKGQLNVPWLLEMLQKAGAAPNAILELWPPQQQTLEQTIALEHAWAAESIQYLRKYIDA
ncbi:MAG TPA: sugar phosphate isomerase/epimerase family protein [Bryobacteraceae bacterium]|nr:sugar phosphate isomerase/epimerase family protein [Bryobacteraceae bacterium]